MRGPQLFLDGAAASGPRRNTRIERRPALSAQGGYRARFPARCFGAPRSPGCAPAHLVCALLSWLSMTWRTNMKLYGPEHIHNVGIFGHAGCGKTTLVEALLHTA